MTSPRNLNSLLDQVVDEDSFLAFVEALRDDRREEEEIEREKPSSPYSSGALGWENGSIGAFLDAAAAWGRATSEGEFGDLEGKGPWRRAAHILYAGKFYE